MISGISFPFVTKKVQIGHNPMTCKNSTIHPSNIRFFYHQESVRNPQVLVSQSILSGLGFQLIMVGPSLNNDDWHGANPRRERILSACKGHVLFDLLLSQ